DRQRGVALTALERDVQAPLADVGPRHELGELFVEAERGSLEMDRADRMPGERHAELHLPGHRLAMKADHARLPAARPAVGDPVEVDEAHGLAGPIRVR